MISGKKELIAQIQLFQTKYLIFPNSSVAYHYAHLVYCLFISCFMFVIIGKLKKKNTYLLPQNASMAHSLKTTNTDPLYSSHINLVCAASKHRYFSTKIAEDSVLPQYKYHKYKKCGHTSQVSEPTL